MPISFGYVGPQMMSNKFVDNPLAAVPSSTVQMYDYEVYAAECALGSVRFADMNPSQRRQLARYVLQHRTDPVSKQQLDALANNNPSFNTFQVIDTGFVPPSNVPRASSSVLGMFLL